MEEHNTAESNRLETSKRRLKRKIPTVASTLASAQLALVCLLLLTVVATAPVAAQDGGEDLSASHFCEGGLGQLLGFIMTAMTLGGLLGGYLLLKKDAMKGALAGNEQGYEKAKRQQAFRTRAIAGIILIDILWFSLARFTPLPGFDCMGEAIISLG